MLASYTRTDIIVEQKRKILYWESSAKKDFKAFPADVQKDMGVALFVVQLGWHAGVRQTLEGIGFRRV